MRFQREVNRKDTAEYRQQIKPTPIHIEDSAEILNSPSWPGVEL